MDHPPSRRPTEEIFHDELLELLGPEYLELDSEFQRIQSSKSINQMPFIPVNQLNTIAQKKAQAQFEREYAAKQTRYHLEPTYEIHPSIQASKKQEDLLPAGPTTKSNFPPLIPISIGQSNNARKKEMYKNQQREKRRLKAQQKMKN